MMVFLIAAAFWYGALVAGVFFFGSFLDNIFVILLIISLVAAAITMMLSKYSERITALEKRVEEFEKKEQ